MLKNGYISCPHFKTELKSWTPNDSKTRMALSFNKKENSALLKWIHSKRKGEFDCLNCLYSFRTKSKLESHKKIRENKDFCGVVRPSNDTKILEFNQYQKFDKIISII